MGKKHKGAAKSGPSQSGNENGGLRERQLPWAKIATENGRTKFPGRKKFRLLTKTSFLLDGSLDLRLCPQITIALKIGIPAASSPELAGK